MEINTKILSQNIGKSNPVLHKTDNRFKKNLFQKFNVDEHLKIINLFNHIDRLNEKRNKIILRYTEKMM